MTFTIDTFKGILEKPAEVARLIRLEKQYGTLLLLLPTLWSLLIASEGKPSLKHIAIFTLGSFIMRSAGCVANDMADRKFDVRVERTKDRPLAAGTLSMEEAFITLAFLLTFAFLLVLMLNRLTILLSFIALSTALLYPFAKRYTYLPQMILGIAFSWGIVMAWTAVRNSLAPTPFFIFLANFFWATGYDTIYALMDREDDLRIGVKSTAVLFGSRSWLAVSIFYTLVLFFMGMAGERLEMGPIYFTALAGAGVFFLFHAVQLRKSPPKETLFMLFRSHVWIGAAILIGITLHYHFHT